MMLSLNPSLNRVPEKIHHIHIMGICGTGMAALAGMLQKSGYTITGSDSAVYPPMSDFLEKLGIEVSLGYAESNLDSNPDLVIVGNVIRQINPEAQTLAALDIPYLSFPQALAHFFIKTRTSLVVSGTHGKTTTCSLLASCLHAAQLDPTFMIGGIVREFAANFRLGTGEFFIAEGDEYDTAFFDKNSKFLHYRPNIAILTSIEFDHADIFDNLEQIKDSFKKFVQSIPEDGLLIANFDDENVVEVAAVAKCTVQSYGLSRSCTWCLSDITAKSEFTEFNVFLNGNLWDSFSIRLPGEHNCLNGMACIALMHHIGLNSSVMKQGLENFAGVKRRQEVRGTVNHITVIDDFAHHPTAVEKTLSALKAAYKGRRLIAVFEPRTNSSRRSIFQEKYATAFGSADLALFKEPLPLEGKPQHELFSCAKLARDVAQNSSITATSYQSTEKILERLGEILVPNDVVVILSNGGFDNIHSRLLDRLGSQLQNS